MRCQEGDSLLYLHIVKNLICLVALFVILVAACGAPGDRQASSGGSSAEPVEAGSSEVLSVFVVNYPLQYLAERIGGEYVEVSFPAPATVDPAYWNPGPETIAAYQQADLILLNGLGYAKWMQRASLPESKLIDTTAQLADRRIELSEGAVHSHGPEGEHSHKGYAFTVWLSPELAIEQARQITAAFSRSLPQGRSQFEANLEALTADLQELDRELRAVAEAIGDQPVLFSHPVYQYLEARYGLSGRSLHWEPDQPPSEDQWRELQEVLADHPARWMIWEGQPPAEVVRRLEDLGVTSLVFDPCANRPASGDLLSVMAKNVENLGAAGSRE